MIAVLVHYSGRVQGVGFRVTASLIAKSFDVTGWVKNLPDGRVALWAEGESDEVHAFLAEVRARMGGCVHDEQRQAQEAAGRFRSFSVVH
jgi:acylphosphatase